MFVVETQWAQTQIPREDAKLGHGDKSAGTRWSARGGYAAPERQEDHAEPGDVAEQSDAVM